MADGFIVRKGGVAEEVLRTTAPSINFVSKTDSQIVVTFTNNDAAEAEVYYGITSTLTDTVTLAAAATSSNITFSGLDDDTAFTVSAYALVTDPTSKKIKSEIVSTVITTDKTPVFTAATGGTTQEYNSGGKRFKSHTFTSDGNFVVSTVGDAAGDRNKVDYLIIAGGASGGTYLGGGGGAGGYRTTLGTSGGPSPTTADKFTVTATTFGIVIGAGGARRNANTFAKGFDGTNSTALGFTLTGGGAGAGADTNQTANSGGSGGGGAQANPSIGNGTSGQGFNGGEGGSGSLVTTGGGGGAGQLGQDGTTNNAGNGGNGLVNTLRTGSDETRAGGGGGAGDNISAPGTGGLGGGGNGGSRSGTFSVASGKDATVNTGSGGGGNSRNTTGAQIGESGAGGSGIVVIRYEIATV